LTLEDGKLRGFVVEKVFTVDLELFVVEMKLSFDCCLFKLKEDRKCVLKTWLHFKLEFIFRLFALDFLYAFGLLY
jgi:hypothetical protein